MRILGLVEWVISGKKKGKKKQKEEILQMARF